MMFTIQINLEGYRISEKTYLFVYPWWIFLDYTGLYEEWKPTLTIQSITPQVRVLCFKKMRKQTEYQYPPLISVFPD